MFFKADTLTHFCLFTLFISTQIMMWTVEGTLTFLTSTKVCEKKTSSFIFLMFPDYYSSNCCKPGFFGLYRGRVESRRGRHFAWWGMLIQLFLGFIQFHEIKFNLDLLCCHYVCDCFDWPPQRQTRNSIIGDQYRWPKTIPYYMEDDLGKSAY